jgi:uracil-DNA glycosylase
VPGCAPSSNGANGTNRAKEKGPAIRDTAWHELTPRHSPGQVFTGGGTCDWLFASLHRTGFANQPTSRHSDDGLRLRDCYITACVRCAPPGDGPTTAERDACLGFLVEELRLLTRVRVILCLGGFAWDGVLLALRALGCRPARKPRFGHRAEAVVGRYTLLGCYHPSQQNTFTGRLTEAMMDAVLARAADG